MHITRSGIKWFLLSLVVTSAITACGTASPVPPNLPSPTVMSVQPGRALAGYGYTAVEITTKEGKVNGYVAVVCGKIKITVCARNLSNEATAAKPNIWVIGGRVIWLQGPHASVDDDRSVFMAVPKHYQKFGVLTPQQQRLLLGCFEPSSTVRHKLGDLDAGWLDKTISLRIGKVAIQIVRTNPIPW